MHKELVLNWRKEKIKVAQLHTLFRPQFPIPASMPPPTTFFQCASHKMPILPAIPLSPRHVKSVNKKFGKKKRKLKHERAMVCAGLRAAAFFAAVVGAGAMGSRGTCFSPLLQKLPLCGEHVTFEYTSAYPEVSKWSYRYIFFSFSACFLFSFFPCLLPKPKKK